MSLDIVYRQNEAIIFIVLLAVLILAAEIGYRLGCRRKEAGIDAPQVSTIQGAILGLLALLLGFTFAMAASRFESRKQLVLDEANAIGTTFLRAQFLPEPFQSESADLLRQYGDARLAFYNAGVDPTKLQKTIIQSEQLQKKLWSSAVAARDKQADPILMGLYVQSLNDMIDLHAKRYAGLQNRVPEVIILLLVTVATLAIAAVGYGVGLGGRRLRLATTLMALVIAMVILVIIDLDRPRRGLILVSQQSLITVQQSLYERDE